MLTRTLTTLFLYIIIFAAPAAAQEFAICYGAGATTLASSAAERWKRHFQRRAQQMQEYGPQLPNLTPLLPRSRPHVPMGPEEVVVPLPPIEELIALTEKCLGKMRCGHPYLHPYYKVAFEKLGCHCKYGLCRPTQFQRVAVTSANPTGIQAWANDRWCDVPEEALRRDRRKIPLILLQFRGHVCLGENGCENLECAVLTETDG